MADSIFGNLPQRRGRDGERASDAFNRGFREAIGMYQPEGPLPPRPELSSRKGGPSIIPGAPSVTPPVVSVAPVASGALTVGSTLSCTTGTWLHSPTSYAYQWLRGGANISAATSSTYVTVSADGGTSVSCKVTASNSAGSASSTSNALAIAAAASSVWSAADAAANGMTLSNGGLSVVQSNSTTNTSIRGTVSKTSGKLYVEFFSNPSGASGIGNERIGLASAGFNVAGQIGQSNYSGGYAYLALERIGSAGFTNNYTTSLYPSAGDVWGMAVDFTTGNMWFAKNNVWLSSSNPATETLPMVTFVPATVGALFPCLTMQTAGEGLWTLQPTAASQKYAPPSGFSPWG